MNKLGKQLLGMAFFCGASSTLFASWGQIHFIDNCTETYTAVKTPCGTKIKLDLFDLDQNKKLNFSIELSPVNSVGIPFKKHAKKYGVVGSNSLSVENTFSLSDEYGNDPDFNQLGRIWKVVARWSQGPTIEEKGTTQNILFIAPPKVTQYFGVANTSKDAILCNWRTRVEVLSNYLFNRESYDLEVSQEVNLSPQNAASGLQTGIQLPVDSSWSLKNGPLFESSGFGPVWFMPQFQRIFGSVNGLNLKINKLLPQNQGGFFVRRTTYNRFSARKMELLNKSTFFSTHYEWAEKESGFLDVPEVVHEFVFVPPAEGQSLRKAQEFLEMVVLPNADNCKDKGFKTGDEFYKVSPELDGHSLYFYSN